jgi:hypothetical protein
MSFAFVAAEQGNSSGSTSITVTKPSGTTENDLLVACVTRNFTASPSTVPSGWTLIAENDSCGQLEYIGVYYKVAGGSEPADYTWEWASISRTSGVIGAYRSGFDISDPIDHYRNTKYLTEDTTVRSATCQVTKDNSAVIFFGAIYSGSSTSWTPDGDLSEDGEFGNNFSDLRTHLASGIFSSGWTGLLDSIIDFNSVDKHAIAFSLNPVTNAFTADGDLPMPEAAATFENIYNTFTAAGELPMPEAAATFGQQNNFTAAGEMPIPEGSATFINSPNEFTAAGDLPIPTGSATFVQENFFTAAGELPMPEAAAIFDLVADITTIDLAYAIYALDGFGNDTVTPSIWERSDSDLDLTPGDGATASTFPTFTDAGNAVQYYEFDGVNDYFSNWPEMPDEYTVVIAKTTSYPDGKPEIQYCNDTTIETALTTPGGFTGALHCIIIFYTELNPVQIEFLEQYMLRRLWRDTFVDPFTARLIRDERCQLCLYCEEEAAQRDDYSLNAIGATDFSTGWDQGITFPVAGAAVVMDADAALNLDALTIFLEAIDFDTDASAETILQNGTNYVLSIALAGNTCTLTLNSSDFAFTAEGFRTLAISVSDGSKPKFYLNGRYVGEGDTNATVSSAAAGQLTIGNNTAKNNPFASTLKKLTIYSDILTDDEIIAAHFGAMATRNFT